MSKTVPLTVPSADEMRDRFAYLQEQINAIEKKSSPLRLKRDALVNKHAEEIRALEADYKKIEEPLFDMKMELGNLVRLLKGATGKTEVPA